MATQKQCERALDRFEDSLSGHRSVVGLGIVRADEDGDPRSLAVGVYVKKKIPVSKLSVKERLPEYLKMTWRGSPITIPVRVIEQGTVELETADGMRG